MWQDDQYSLLLHWLLGDALVDTCPVGAEDPPPLLAFFFLWTHLLIRSKKPTDPTLEESGSPSQSLNPRPGTPTHHYSGETSCPDLGKRLINQSSPPPPSRKILRDHLHAGLGSGLGHVDRSLGWVLLLTEQWALSPTSEQWCLS